MAGLGTFVTGFSFWIAVAMLGSSGALAIPKVRFGRGVPASRGAGVLFVGLICALLIAAAPSIMVTSSDVASGLAGGQGGGTARPSLMEYFATLSTYERWIAGATVAVWVAAVLATIAAALSRLGPTAE